MNKPRRTPTLRFAAVAPASLACAVAASSARGAPSCEGPEIAADEHVAPRWARAVDSLRRDLRSLPDVDRCGRVVLFGAGDDVVIDVALRDGRSTVRRVTRPEALPAIVSSLLLLPPGDALAAPSAVAAPSASAPPSAPPPALPAAAAPPPAKAPPPSRRVDLEVGAGLSGRLSTDPGYGALGASAFAQLALDRLLFGVAFRVSAFEKLTKNNPTGFYAESTALSAQVGVRADAGPVAFDLMAGPELVLEAVDQDFGEAEGPYASANDIRAAATLRASPSPLRELRPFVQLDADASPRRLLGGKRQPHPSLPALPSASFGLSLGLAGVLF